MSKTPSPTKSSTPKTPSSGPLPIFTPTAPFKNSPSTSTSTNPNSNRNPNPRFVRPTRPTLKYSRSLLYPYESLRLEAAAAFPGANAAAAFMQREPKSVLKPEPDYLQELIKKMKKVSVVRKPTSMTSMTRIRKISQRKKSKKSKNPNELRTPIAKKGQGKKTRRKKPKTPKSKTRGRPRK